jgi:hypothetical protein
MAGHGDEIVAALHQLHIAGWSAGERAALGRIVDLRIAPLIRMRRRWFFVTGAFAFVMERPRGGGYSVSRVPSN